MNFKFIKKIFFVGPKPKECRVMLQLTEKAHKTLAHLANDQGETIQKVIYDALEQFLTEAVKQGFAPNPDEDDATDVPAVNAERAIS